MKKWLLILIIINVICASCGSVPVVETPAAPAGPVDTVANIPVAEAFAARHWITQPSGSTITIVGIAGRQRNLDDAIKEAVNDAARKASLYQGVYGEYTLIHNQGNNLLEYFVDTQFKVEPLNNNPASYIDSLVFDKDTDVLLRQGTVYVRTRYSGVDNVPVYTSTIAKDGKPHWINSQSVVIPGYYTGIGGSRNKGSVQSTCRASYESAVLDVVRQLSTSSQNSLTDIEGGGGRMTKSTSSSKGTLSRVIILETYFDQKTSGVYTLIAAKAEGEN